MSESRVYSWAAMPVVKRANGGESRDVLHGRLETGEAIALHVSVQPGGAAPNPAHRIEHTELILVSAGTLEFAHDGQVETVRAGGVILVAVGTMHAVRNVGEGPATYFVLAIGGDVKG